MTQKVTQSGLQWEGKRLFFDIEKSRAPKHLVEGTEMIRKGVLPISLICNHALKHCIIPSHVQIICYHLTHSVKLQPSACTVHFPSCVQPTLWKPKDNMLSEVLIILLMIFQFPTICIVTWTMCWLNVILVICRWTWKTLVPAMHFPFFYILLYTLIVINS